MKYILTFFWAFLTLPQMNINAQYCVSGCNENTYVNSIDPNTIEYDNMVGVFHSSMVKESDGKIKVWGQGTAFNGTGSSGNILVPQEINATNYPGLTGSILKFAAGSNVNNQQFAVLTTTGLFIWGGSLGSLVSATVKASNVFGAVSVGTFGVVGTKTDGLPDGVAPADVKMMFGTKNTLAIVTCTGQAWMLSTSSNKYGDGSTENAANSAVWHRVKTDATTNLGNVVAVRGTVNAMMALTSDGNIYTWGSGTYDGSGASANRTYATLMVKPAGITPKMIGMTRSDAGVSYYLLATNGDLYSLGENDSKQLGIFSTTDSNVWVRVQQSATAGDFLLNVVWISPQEHEGGNYAAINVLTSAGKLWAWGNSNNGMLGAGTGTVDPIYMPGSIPAGPVNPGKLNKTDTLIAVETGGHTTLTIKQCSTKFGYVGHKINGSMADGSSATGTITEYNFSDTASLSICGAIAGPAVKDLKVCAGTLADLTNAEPTSLPPGATSIQWWTTITRDAGTQVVDKTSVPAGTYYAFYDPLIVTCPSMITVSYYIATDPEFGACSESDLQVTKTVDNLNAAVGNNVKFTIVAKNNGLLNNTDVTVNDLLPNGFSYDYHYETAGTTYVPATGVWTIGNLNNGATRTLTIYAKVNATGNYTNTAVISTTSGIIDPNLANNTADATVTVVCVEKVDGQDFAANDGSPQTFTQPATNFGFVFDIFELDNSFTLNINGTDLATSEIQFQSAATPPPGINIRFVDGDLYEVDTPDVWQMDGTAAAPLIRVIISPTGVVSMYGSKVSGGPLFPLELFNGNAFNTITWNPGAPNTIIATQVVTGPTYISGTGYGLNVVPCACYDDANTATAGVPTNHGITLLQRAGGDNGNWPMIRNSAYTVLESNTKGFVVTRIPTADFVNITNPIDGMMVYDTTEKCLKIYTVDEVTSSNTGWKCYNLPACP